MTITADVIVLGLGPGGEEAAGRLAESGLEVLAVDDRLVGGECPYWGCVPSKAMIRAANLLAEARRVDGMAGSATVVPDWAPVARRVRELTSGWNDRVAVQRLEQRGARFLRGQGRLDGPNAVLVRGERLEARRAVLVNIGTVPWVPPVPGLDASAYWTNRDAIELERLPRSLVVLGGGAIAVELAQVFARFGVTVSVVEAATRLVPHEEPESSDVLTEVFRQEGIAVHTGAEIISVHRDDGTVVVDLERTGPVSGERLLVATGRNPDLSLLGAATIGVDENARTLPTDEHMRVTEGVWAIGDVTGHGAFTHMSVYEALIAVDDILGRSGEGAQYHAVPRVTFTDPEVGAVGMTAQQAHDADVTTRTALSPLPGSTRGWIHGPGNAGFIKLVEDAERGVLVGATSVGPCGGEVLSMLTLAVHARIPTHELRRMIYAYPTFHRAMEPALDSLLQ